MIRLLLHGANQNGSDPGDTLATSAMDMSARARRLASAGDPRKELTAVDSAVGVGTARKGARERLWAFATGVVRNRPRLRSLIDVARFLARSTGGDVCTCTLCGKHGRFLP